MGMMTLEEAIEHCDEKADCTECGKEHKQLGEWLRELKRLKSGGTVTNEKLIAWLCGRFSADYVWTIEKLTEKVLEVCTEESDWTKVADCVECDGEAAGCNNYTCDDCSCYKDCPLFCNTLED
jgi:hypothetical protein